MPRENRTITEADILPLSEWAKVRVAHRKALSERKKRRRVAIGPHATLLFENWDTMWYQVQEMLWIEKGGADQLPDELAALKGVREHVNVFTNFNAFRDSAPNLCHYTGWIITRTGSAPIGQDDRPGETLDVSISRVIGRNSRFQSITATALSGTLKA